MEDFRIIYRILKYLRDSMDFEEFDFDGFTAEHFGTNENRFRALLAELQRAGYIDIPAAQYIRQAKAAPHITLKGLEYLNENSTMKQVSAIAKGAIDIIK